MGTDPRHADPRLRASDADREAVRGSLAGGVECWGSWDRQGRRSAT